MALAASSWRAELDQRLRKVGQDVVITRQLGGTSTKTVTCRAFVRLALPQEDARGLVPSAMVGSIAQPDTIVTISGTELDAAGWPLTNGWPLPVRTDTVTVAGKDRTVQVIEPIFVGGALARINLTVRG